MALEEANFGSPARRKAIFTMIDGSPSFSEWQHQDEPVEEFAERMAREISGGGGYVSLAGVKLYEVVEDPVTQELIEQAAKTEQS